ncbi:hypothetical protein FG379_001017 [Cryptosporidium bovis]|uniref:uncharacterized protein n=1 Tax=Cryptosporidium bovis TaxID=310047 RepID=UPI00351A8D25|nr:hypothetical protein FG379_001017 [Cryptosporidium bovis]
MKEHYYHAHSPGTDEIIRSGKYSRKSAPPVIRAIPRTNKRFTKSPFTAEQMEKISSEYISTYKDIYKDSVIAYTEKKIKSKKKCEIFRKFMFGRENNYFDNLKKCIIYDTDWMKEKKRRDESELINYTNNEIVSTSDIYLLSSVISDKVIEQRNLLLKLKKFWKDFPTQLKMRANIEKELLMNEIGTTIPKKNVNNNVKVDIEKKSNSLIFSENVDIQNFQDFTLEQLEQMNLIVDGYDITIGKLSSMVEKLSDRVEQILGAEKRLHNVANALIANSARANRDNAPRQLQKNKM